MSTQKEDTTLVLSAGTLTGDKVKNSAGEDLGKVEEIMIDIRDGRVSYVVLSFGGFMGMGDKYFAIPWGMLEVDLEEECFRLDIDKTILEDAPGFDKNNWPEVTPDWLYDLYDYYDMPPYWG